MLIVKTRTCSFASTNNKKFTWYEILDLRRKTNDNTAYNPLNKLMYDETDFLRKRNISHGQCTLCLTITGKHTPFECLKQNDMVSAEEEFTAQSTFKKCLKAICPFFLIIDSVVRYTVFVRTLVVREIVF